MKRTTKHLMTTLCCTALLAAAGCSSTGELSVTGMYGSQGQALSGDRCDELLMDAAEADSAESQEEAQRDYRECVEEALEEDGRDGECREDDDDTCDVILEEVGDAIERLRGEGNEAPECDAPSSNSEEALCHLMAAYEACELDRDNDGDPDVEDRDESDRPDEDGDRPDEERDGDPDDENAEGDEPHDGGDGGEGGENGESEEPREGDEGGEGGAEEPHEGEGDEPSEGGDGGAFCDELEREIDECDNAEERGELEEIHERECTP